MSSLNPFATTFVPCEPQQKRYTVSSHGLGSFAPPFTPIMFLFSRPSDALPLVTLTLFLLVIFRLLITVDQTMEQRKRQEDEKFIDETTEPTTVDEVLNRYREHIAERTEEYLDLPSLHVFTSFFLPIFRQGGYDKAKS
ncbi:hypothetical protein K501DRAFT_267158 [Backusella circina FSU 941]|nr:hypothetical protein K501DRAFT_267158 [Backusella circina FSU 941]